jgi:hypothetical protein
MSALTPQNEPKVAEYAGGMKILGTRLVRRTFTLLHILASRMPMCSDLRLSSLPHC